MADLWHTCMHHVQCFLFFFYDHVSTVDLRLRVQKLVVQSNVLKCIQYLPPPPARSSPVQSSPVQSSPVQSPQSRFYRYPIQPTLVPVCFGAAITAFLCSFYTLFQSSNLTYHTKCDGLPANQDQETSLR